MMDAEGPGAIVRFWMTFSGINRGQGTLRIYIDNEEKPVIEGNVRDILSGQVLCGEPLSTSVPDEAPMEERGHNLYLPIPYAKRCKVTIESPDLKITPEGKIESKTIVYYAINYRTYTSPVKVISFSAKELKKNARLIAAVNKKLSEGTPGIDTPLAGRESTLNLAASLAELGKKVLVVDMDPQGNTTSGLGIDKEQAENTVYELMLEECSVEDAIMESEYENLSVLPSNINLAAAEIELVGAEEKEYILKKAIDKVKKNYDFVLIDCPPSLSMLTINAMCAADTVLVPIQCEYYALEGLSQLIHTINLVQDRLNPDLEIEGVVFTMYDARTNLSLQVVENVKNNLDQNIYKTIIPRNVRLAEAPSYGMPITRYDKRSTGAESYRRLAEEVIHRGEEEWL